VAIISDFRFNSVTGGVFNRLSAQYPLPKFFNNACSYYNDHDLSLANI